MYGKMQESGLTEIIFLICTTAIWGLYPVFAYPELPQGSAAHVGGLPSLMTDPLLLVRNLPNIWETFHCQILSHGAGRLIPVQAKILDMPLQVLIFGLGLLIIKDSLDLLSNYDPVDIFPCCFFPYLESHYYNSFML